jgi:hypothetical protein
MYLLKIELLLSLGGTASQIGHRLFDGNPEFFSKASLRWAGSADLQFREAIDKRFGVPHALDGDVALIEAPGRQGRTPAASCGILTRMGDDKMSDRIY